MSTEKKKTSPKVTTNYLQETRVFKPAKEFSAKAHVKSLAQYNGAVRTIAAPEVAGSFLVRAISADGRRTILRLIRY